MNSTYTRRVALAISPIWFEMMRLMQTPNVDKMHITKNINENLLLCSFAPNLCICCRHRWWTMLFFFFIFPTRKVWVFERWWRWQTRKFVQKGNACAINFSGKLNLAITLFSAVLLQQLSTWDNAFKLAFISLHSLSSGYSHRAYRAVVCNSFEKTWIWFLSVYFLFYYYSTIDVVVEMMFHTTAGVGGNNANQNWNINIFNGQKSTQQIRELLLSLYLRIIKMWEILWVPLHAQPNFRRMLYEYSRATLTPNRHEWWA